MAKIGPMSWSNVRNGRRNIQSHLVLWCIKLLGLMAKYIDFESDFIDAFFILVSFLIFLDPKSSWLCFKGISDPADKNYYQRPLLSYAVDKTGLWPKHEQAQKYHLRLKHF